MNPKADSKKSAEKSNPSLKRIVELEAQLETLQAQADESQGQAMRALADLENFRRREAENRQNWSELAVSDFLQKFLPSFLELGLGAAHSTDEDIKKVVEKFFTTAQSLGLTQINPIPGAELDPDQHEVLMVAEGEPGKIVQVFEPGWQFGTKVLVPAKVSSAA